MEVSGTISSYLEGDDKFDYLFWTSYSIDPITIEFLFKNDLVNCLNNPYFHFICDKNKLDETIESSLDDPKRVNRLAQMQNYILLSKERVEGAFHPKILFFSKEDKIKCIVLSGNATSSGILSNQDLIARFEWSTADGEVNQSELASIYQFLVSFDGWNNESRSELDNVAETHPWLLELRSENVFYSDGISPLLGQFVETLPIDWVIEKILIFSPFTDPNLRALTEISKKYSSTPIVLFYPDSQIEVNSPDTELPENLTIRSSGLLTKSRFHAKYYAFLGKDDAYALWGSANCSYSALLSSNRNREILVGYHFKLDHFLELWPGSVDTSHPKVELVAATETETEKKPHDIDLLDGRIDEETIELITRKNFKDKQLRLLLFDGNELNAGAVSTDHCSVKVTVENTHKICGALICNAAGKKISNALFLNNFGKIQKIISGAQDTPDYDHLKAKKKNLVHRLGTEFFVLDRDKPKTGSSSKRGSSSGAFAFWHMPRYRQRLSSAGIFGHQRFISSYVGKHKRRIDPDGDDSNGGNGAEFVRHVSKQDRTALWALNQQAGKIFNILKVRTKDKRLEGKIPFDRWLKGEDYMLRYFLDTLYEYEILEERDLIEIKSFLRNFLRLVFYTVGKVNIDQYEEGVEFVKSLNMMCSLYLLLTKYTWSKMSYDRGTLSTTEGFDDYLNALADAVFMKILAERQLEASGLNRAYEAKTLLLEQVITYLHHAKAAHQALSFTAPGLMHVCDFHPDPNDIVILSDNVYLFKGLKDSNTLEFSDLLDNRRSFSAEYVRPESVYKISDALGT